MDKVKHQNTSNVINMTTATTLSHNTVTNNYLYLLNETNIHNSHPWYTRRQQDSNDNLPLELLEPVSHIKPSPQ